MARPNNTFSAYASHFINASTALNKSFYREAETPEPLFFSVAEGSHLAHSKDSIPAGQARGRHYDEESDEDDDAYPRLDGSAGSALRSRREMDRGEEVDSDADQYHQAGPSTSRPPAKKPSDDPYLDEEDLENEAGFPPDTDSIPLIASGTHSPPSRAPAAPQPKTAPGWLAHFSVSRTQTPQVPGRSTSPRYIHSSPSTSPSPSEDSRRSSDSLEPPLFLEHPTSPPPRPLSATLSESLLPRDGVSRPLFTLPEGHRIPRHKYNDSLWTVLWCTSLLVCGIASVVVLFVTVSPSGPALPDKMPSPYSTITRSIPMLTFIVILSSIISYFHLILLRFAVRPMLIITGMAIPLCLFVGAAWSFAGSFAYDSADHATWGETVGLRLFSLVPLALSILSARSLYHRRHALLRTVAVVELSSTVVLDNLPVLGLSLALLLGAMIASLPFLSLITRLTLIGYYSQKPSDNSWHVRGYAGWMAFLATGVWLWSWGVVRGALRVAVSGVVGNWYFSRSQPESARMDSVTATHAAFARANGASLGSICVATLVLTFTRCSIFILRTIRRVTVPPQFAFLAPLHPLEWIARLIAVFESLGAHTLTYVGLTGESFWVGTKHARELVHSGGKSGKAKGSRAGEYELLGYLLTVSCLSFALVAAIGGYVVAAHSAAGATNAALMALLTGGVTFLTVTFGVGVGEDAADALFLCYRMDSDANTRHCKEAFDAFEGRSQSQVAEP